MSTPDIVNSWFRDRLAAGALARDTEAYNQVIEALPDLIARLDPPAEPAPIDTNLPDIGTPPDPAAGKKG